VRRAATAATIALALLAGAAAEAAAPKTDIVVLRNGDRLTCEVTQMRQGKLQVKTDDAGTISIEWDKVTSVTTADLYEVTLRDGAQLLGRLRPGAVGRTLAVEGIGGTASPAMSEVASFEHIKKTFWSRIDGSFDLGGSYTKSSGVAELGLNADARYRRPQYAVAAKLSMNLTHQSEESDTTRYTASTTYSRYRGAWIVSTLGLVEGNRDLGFTFRGTAAESIGHYAVRGPHAELLFGGGMALGRETPVDASQVTNVDALAVASFSFFTYDYPTTRIDVTLLTFPSLDDPGRIRLNADAKLKREIFHDFFVSFSGYDSYDNRPKSVSAQRNDLGLSLSFGWSF
jgi:opacity protein-like surface antigen